MVGIYPTGIVTFHDQVIGVVQGGQQAPWAAVRFSLEASSWYIALDSERNQ